MMREHCSASRCQHRTQCHQARDRGCMKRCEYYGSSLLSRHSHSPVVLMLSAHLGLVCCRPLSWWRSNRTRLLINPVNQSPSGSTIELSTDRSRESLARSLGRRKASVELRSVLGSEACLLACLLTGTQHITAEWRPFLARRRLTCELHDTQTRQRDSDHSVTGEIAAGGVISRPSTLYLNHPARLHHMPVCGRYSGR